jgi:hypothetical protein
MWIYKRFCAHVKRNACVKSLKYSLKREMFRTEDAEEAEVNVLCAVYFSVPSGLRHELSWLAWMPGS